jgi:predicted metal-dependent phosphoesterase TrpH
MVERARAAGARISWAQVSAIAGSAPVGRPHVAQALLEAGDVAAYADAFSADWIGHGGRAYEPKHALDPAAAVRLVVGAGGVPVLAHPGSRAGVGDRTIRDMVAAGLVGLEVDHPEHDAATRARLRARCVAEGLLATGGSDFHGDRKPTRLGAEVTGEAVLAEIVRRATGASPVAA